jgi:hypothetical protein
LLDRYALHLPDPDHPEVIPFGRAFVRMMFAHAEFEARARGLHSVVTGDPKFGERGQLWPSDKRPKLMAALIAKHLGEILETTQIEDYLRRAIPLCHVRNHLVHGEWWQFDSATNTVTVRGGRDYPSEDQHKNFSVEDIERTAEGLSDIEAELFKLQRAVETHCHHELRQIADSDKWEVVRISKPKKIRVAGPMSRAEATDFSSTITGEFKI